MAKNSESKLSLAEKIQLLNQTYAVLGPLLAMTAADDGDRPVLMTRTNIELLIETMELFNHGFVEVGKLLVARFEKLEGSDATDYEQLLKLLNGLGPKH